MKPKSFILYIAYFISFLSYSQTVSGTVYDKSTNKALPGASVYLDGTTIGDVSDFNGFFELNTAKIINTPLIISYTGYKTVIITPAEFKKISKIYLEQKANQLKEIMLATDIWSRERKLRIFKTEFLGQSKNAAYCTISNEKDIQLVHNSTTKTLIAYCDKPIIIKNRYLGYTIYYNLTEFEIIFNQNDFTSSNGLISSSKQIYIEGYSFFSNLKKETKKRKILNRKKTYEGSRIHFLHSLANKKLTENNFEIYYESWLVNPYKYFDLSLENNLTKVEVSIESLSVLYKRSMQSKITFVLQDGICNFYIDKSGNHTPPKNINFSGDFGFKRMSDLLPLNYSIQ